MPATLDDLPGALVVPTRDAERDKWLRSYRFRDPSSDTSPGTEPYIRASVFADAAMPHYANAVTAANATDPNKVGGKEIDARAGAEGVPRLGPQSSSGSVTITASVGGTTIVSGDELTLNALRFRYNGTTALFNDGDEVPIISIDTGPATNLAPGTVLTWSNSRAGCGPSAKVFQQVDGSGLTGGRDTETDDQYRARWLLSRQEPAASGNDAEIQKLAESTFGVPVQKAFSYPAVLGPGTTCVVFTVRVDAPGQSRIPTAPQIASVLGNLATMPADEGILAGTLISQPVDLAFGITWDDAAPGWTDSTQWPPYYAGGGAILVTAAASPTSFTLNGTTTIQPQVGQHIAFYDVTGGQFRRKTILSFTGTGPWVITCDPSNNASDLSYTPVVGQRACPWSDSLQDLVDPLFSYFTTLGPGEQVASFFDTGNRQRRQPQSPHSYPNVISNKGISAALELDAIFDEELLEPSVPYTTTVGSPGVSSYLIQMRYLAAFPQS